jgi:hypothetical protein
MDYYLLFIGYNALGEKFHDEIIEFIKQAKEDPKLKMSDLYAHCGDVFYNVFKHQRKDDEAKEVITTLLELFNLSVVSFEDQQMQDRAELENRNDKLKEVCKKETLGQPFTDFIDGLSHDEPVEKIQFEFERSHPIFNPRVNFTLRTIEIQSNNLISLKTKAYSKRH